MKKFIQFKKQYLFVSLLLIFCIFESLRVYFAINFIQENQYSVLANSFIHGKLTVDLINLIVGSNDTAFFKGNYYVYFGPIPALLLIPINLINSHISQQVFGLTFLMYSFFIVYKIANNLKLKKEDSLWLATFFTFGSVFLTLGIVNISAYQVQVIATGFVLFAIYEFYSQRRWFIIGLWIALAAATRLTLVFSVIFFALHLFSEKPGNQKIKNLIFLFIPIIIAMAALGFYNFIRFGSPLNSGYSMNAEFPPDLVNLITRNGLFSYKYIPSNLYYLFLKGPDPIFSPQSKYIFNFPFIKASQWGLGIFFTSPIFLYLFSANFRQKNVLFCWITSFFLMIPILTYFGIGSWQYGYRYAVDIYPFLFLILCEVFKKDLPNKAKFLIVYGTLFNFYLMLSVWNIYPFF